ncbi:MAG: hypothetical protein AAF090_13070 [Bacteroidota bacterium]
MNTVESKTEYQALKTCLTQIEKQLGWGDSAKWPSANFEHLSDKIFETTGVQISHNTLKRIWGRIPYTSKPSTSTLNAMALFLGYENWSAFVAYEKKKSIPSQKQDEKREVNLKKRWKRRGVVLPISIVGALVLIFLVSYGNGLMPKTETYEFSMRKITRGLPNTVIFSVDAMDANNADHIEIQQNWDSRKRETIYRTDSLVTSIYHAPGFFDAKLVVNDEIVKEESLLIESDGWLAVVERDEVPLYIDSDDFHKANGIGVLPETLQKAGIATGEENLVSNVYWVEEFEGLTLKDVTMETTLRHVSYGNANPCQMTEIIMLCQGQVILIPLSIKGCVSDLRLFVLDQGFNGKRTDLSAFGVDFSEDIKVTCIAKNDKVAIKINGEEVYQAPLNEAENGIFGVKYRFHGAGMVTSLTFKNEERVFLDESFPQP